VFVALVIKNSLRMRSIVICGLSGCTIYSTSHKRHDFGGEGGEGLGSFERGICDLIFSGTFFETFLILRRTERYVHKCILVFM
jgi:hypothetical protein